jgi:hypothetical protein
MNVNMDPLQPEGKGAAGAFARKMGKLLHLKLLHNGELSNG